MVFAFLLRLEDSFHRAAKEIDTLPRRLLRILGVRQIDALKTAALPTHTLNVFEARHPGALSRPATPL